MIIVHSKNLRPVGRSGKVAALIETIEESTLRGWVERVSVPRHFTAERGENLAVAKWISGLLEGFGYRVERQEVRLRLAELDREDWVDAGDLSEAQKALIEERYREMDANPVQSFVERSAGAVVRGDSAVRKRPEFLTPS